MIIECTHRWMREIHYPSWEFAIQGVHGMAWKGCGNLYENYTQSGMAFEVEVEFLFCIIIAEM